MATEGVMSSKHARSPTIKIVVGPHETLSDEDLDTPLNVFHVNKTLLAANSTYFTILLDSVPDRNAIFPPEHDYDVVADWLDLLYTGTLSSHNNDDDNDNKRILTAEDVQKYFKFADLVGSEKLKNTVMDAMQELPLSHWGLEWPVALERLGLYNSPLMNYIFECLAYRMVLRGWKRFANARPAAANRIHWFEFISDTNNRDHLWRLLGKLDGMNFRKDGCALVAPDERRDCKWHEHLTKESKERCYRNVAGRNNVIHQKESTVWTREAQLLSRLECLSRLAPFPADDTPPRREESPTDEAGTGKGTKLDGAATLGIESWDGDSVEESGGFIPFP